MKLIQQCQALLALYEIWCSTSYLSDKADVAANAQHAPQYPGARSFLTNDIELMFLSWYLQSNSNGKLSIYVMI